jgi:hypothetical protein
VGGSQFLIQLAVEFRQRFGGNFGFGHSIILLPSLCRKLAHRASAHSPARNKKTPLPHGGRSGFNSHRLKGRNKTDNLTSPNPVSP